MSQNAGRRCVDLRQNDLQHNFRVGIQKYIPHIGQREE